MRQLLAEGRSQNAIAAELGVVKSTVAYHCRNLERPVDDQCSRRYDWLEVQRFYDTGNSATACRKQFGFSRGAWYDAVRRGDITPRPTAMPIEALLQGKRGRAHVKLRLMSAGLLPTECADCGLAEWRGEPISLCLHHINGVGNDNRLENLTLLCPNCHSQTDNFSGRNRGARKLRLVDQSG